MQSGLLWFDGSKTPLDAKIRRAAERYLAKFGVRPNRCFVNPVDLQGVDAATLPVPTTGKSTILPNHFWLGVEAQGGN